jgi:hypothetical protein
VGERHNQQLIAAQRRERAVTMYLYGHSQEEIARELGVSQSRIVFDNPVRPTSIIGNGPPLIVTIAYSGVRG